MTKTNLSTILLAFLMTAACTQHTFVSNTEVDRLSLLRSMTYTHRHLVNIGFGDQASINSYQKSLLLLSHCDLNRRNVVYSENSPAVCKSSGKDNARFCIAEFHRCIGTCDSFRQNCSFCEQRGVRCLDQDNK